ncbi:MAG: prepilin-type N-terminal cleavage/methylation domain-containing protein [Elusimicrobia bacterium]|nr:prepilin-type N-terminal cleavage/methylation domain-containing protein [Elusimicrobiota bacterium]
MKKKKGYTLVEIMIAMVVLVLGLIPLVKLIGDSLVATSDLGSRSVANELAQDLMEEIKQRKWDENAGADGLTATASRSAINLAASMDAGESAANKTTFDDIDDYNALQGTFVEHPPRDASNVAMGQYSKFSRSVQVRYMRFNTGPPANFIVEPTDGGLGTTAPGRTDYKQIQVTVSWSSGGGKGRSVVHQTIMANIARR